MTPTPVLTVFMEVSWGARGYISEWYEDLELEAQVEFDNLLIELAATPRASWGMPDFKSLGGGIFELRFKAGGKQYRPLGYDGPRKHQFTILIGAYKKMKMWTPHEAPKTAIKRRKDVESGMSRVRPYGEHLFTNV